MADAQGGLAAVTEEEEEVYGPPAPLDVAEIVGRTTGSGAEPTMKQLILQNKETQMERLRAGRTAIAERRAKTEKEDARGKWLALAQGMLAPTRTGGFGESLGASAGLLRQEQELRRGHEGERIQEETNLMNQETDIQNQFIQDELRRAQLEKEAQLGEYSRRRPIGTDKLYPHPENPEFHARGQQIWDPDMKMEDGSTGGSRVQWLDVDDDGVPLRAISNLDAETRARIQFEIGLSEEQAARFSADIETGRDAFKQVTNLTRTLELMRRVQLEGQGTGGWVALLQGMSEWFGVDTAGVTDLGVLRNKLGQAVLHGLKNFPGQISEGERKYMEALENGLSKPAGVNIALLQEGLVLQRERHRIGVRAARQYGTPLDLQAMGVDPNNPDVVAEVDKTIDEPGSHQGNPIIVSPSTPKPDVGKWIKLPNGTITQVK